MAATDDIISNIPMTQLAQQLGVDEQQAEAATREAIPALLGGLQANSQDTAGAQSLAGALNDHTDRLGEGEIDLAQVDTADGSKIVSNIFGGNTDQVVATLGDKGVANSGLVQKLLPILAPIVLAYVAKQMSGTKYGGLLGPLLAGAAGGPRGGGAANPLNDLLGGLLGGSSAPATPTASEAEQKSGGGILDMLGGLLSGGRR